MRPAPDAAGMPLMFDWLFEGRLPVLLFILLLAGLLAFIWRNVRDRRLLAAAAFFVFLALLYWILNFLVETDREQIGRKLDEMNAALNKPDLDAVFRHTSESFKFLGYDKKNARIRAESAMASLRVRNVRIWEVEVEELDPKQKKAKVNFKVKADHSLSSGAEFALCRSVWVLDSDGQWRMQACNLYNPLVDTTSPLTFPF
jgi:hypothetical protein